MCSGAESNADVLHLQSVNRCRSIPSLERKSRRCDDIAVVNANISRYSFRPFTYFERETLDINQCAVAFSVGCPHSYLAAKRRRESKCITFNKITWKVCLSELVDALAGIGGSPRTRFIFGIRRNFSVPARNGDASWEMIQNRAAGVFIGMDTEDKRALDTCIANRQRTAEIDTSQRRATFLTRFCTSFRQNYNNPFLPELQESSGSATSRQRERFSLVVSSSVMSGVKSSQAPASVSA